MWGNEAHIAPELHSLLGSTLRQRQTTTIKMDYSKQGVFELGVLGFEVLIGSGPIEGYPASCTDRDGVVHYSDDQIAPIIDHQQANPHDQETAITREQEEMLRRAVSCDPSRRPSLDEMIDCFDTDGSLRLC